MKMILPLMLVAFSSQAQSIVGKWKTIDENTGEAKSVVDIFERGGKFYGKIVRLFSESDPDPVCDKCDEEDPRFRKKVIGMEILLDLERHGEEFSEGTVLDPEDGKVYRCKLWLEGKNLKIRGYWGPFFRTQTWEKAS
ncbi:Uncharacterized conserved protein, DUF2147 family [Chryseolinea serpens]|uniref:Uncharacterized conserved protein, DUF2147 family n=1 Tax=Chryseolinea serpens TaxID=947013 RepID=A0A1M5KNQ1_9BACT|nr:DUF2147 domain-containing protein [Chryseolinea serpens]SHG54462.1 Uncharacterized conserved protein, DUF2147 family [Chryseolinea serpens]